MKVVILGAGQVGQSIARYLTVDENDVTIVDQAPDLLSKISNSLDIQPVVGFASNPDVLEKAGAYKADLLIAVTASDEVNIVACEVANALFKVDTKIARIRSQNYLNPHWSQLFAPNNIAIDVIISPEVEVARAIAGSIQIAGAFDVIRINGSNSKIIGVRCRSFAPILNTPLKLLPGLFPKLNLVILFVVRQDQSFIPHENHQLLSDDEVYFIISHDQVHEAMEIFGFSEDDEHGIVIMGGGIIGFTLAKELELNHPSVTCKIIEKDPQRAEYVARNLKKTEVLCGDALDYEVLTEAGIASVETAVAVTQDDKVNILSSLLAKRHGVTRSLTLLNNMAYSSLITSLGVDAVINPRSITVSTILQNIRRGRVRSVYSLYEGSAEIIEAEARETSNIIGLGTDDINIMGEIQIAALIRDNDTIIAPSKIIVHVGDRLILVVSKEQVHKIERLFAIRPRYP